MNGELTGNSTRKPTPKIWSKTRKDDFDIILTLDFTDGQRASEYRYYPQKQIDVAIKDAYQLSISSRRDILTIKVTNYQMMLIARFSPRWMVE